MGGVIQVLTRTTVYSRKNGRTMRHKGDIFSVDEADFNRYSEALLASDPLLDENDSDDELHQ